MIILGTSRIANLRHSRAGGNPISSRKHYFVQTWIPACVGMAVNICSPLNNSSTGAASRLFLVEKARQCLTIVFALLIFAAGNLQAQVATPAMPPMSPELEARLKKLETELRCLVCQNQTLAESPAGLAGDLRREVRLLADSGKSDNEIKQHLKARYGDFVLYNPELDIKTWLLWFGPFVLLAGGAVIVLVINRRVRSAPAGAPALGEKERDRASKLLDDEDKQ